MPFAVQDGMSKRPMQPQVTILIPHYKTLPLTKLCLQLLKSYTDLNQARIIVIENGSGDGSLEALQQVDWIQVIPRAVLPDETPVQSHSRALDLALASVTTPYVLSIHTDTLVLHPAWLPFLVAQLKARPTIAGVGSWKLESKGWARRFLKQLEHRFYRPALSPKEHYLRSHCALYRTDLLKAHQLHFSGGEKTAGKYIHEQLTALGYEMIFLPSEILSKYLLHLNHATTILNPALSRRARVDRDLTRIRKELRRMSKTEAFEMPF